MPEAAAAILEIRMIRIYSFLDKKDDTCYITVEITLNYLMPESSRKNTMTQNPGARAEIAENVVARVTLTKTVLFLPNWSVRNPDTCDDIAMPKNETLDSIPLRIVSNSKSHLAVGMI